MREQPCPMCTSLMAAWDGEALDVEQRVALAMVARSPIERLLVVKKQRGWRHLKLYSDVEGLFTRDYVSADDADMPAFNAHVAMAAFATSGAAKWAAVRQTPARTRAVRLT